MAQKFVPSLEKGPLPLRPIRCASEPHPRQRKIAAARRGAGQLPTPLAAAWNTPLTYLPPACRDASRRALLDLLDSIRGRQAPERAKGPPPHPHAAGMPASSWSHPRRRRLTCCRAAPPYPHRWPAGRRWC